ncbi:MAG: MerR family transcriptional regulator [Candidatus Hydrogenedentes bacterium]|nr:MerR family transcriptional regulator [Candidatus Hydrogenedentota bacterium]
MKNGKSANDRYYQISEVSRQTDLPVHLLRQWEAKFPQLRPKRSRTNRRYYTSGDIDVIRRINYLLYHEKMTIEGARLRLAQEIHGRGKPQTNQEVVDVLDKIEAEIRGMLSLIDRAREEEG